MNTLYIINVNSCGNTVSHISPVSLVQGVPQKCFCSRQLNQFSQAKVIGRERVAIQSNISNRELAAAHDRWVALD